MFNLPHRPHKVTPRCSECAEPLSWFEGEWFCPNCVSYMTIPELVGLECACPCCKERRMDCLGWLDEETVCCSSCGTRYEPGIGSIDRN